MGRWLVGGLILGLIVLPGPGLAKRVTTEGTVDLVVLLHGLRRSSASMLGIAWMLEKNGYRVVNIDYPSTSHTVETLTREYLEARLLKEVPGTGFDRIHFVCHSLGCILLRTYLRDHELERLGSVVMLGPPNQGSELVDALMPFDWYAALHGPAGMQLGETAAGITHGLGPIQARGGGIAGTKTCNPLFSHIIDGEDDGKVAVASTMVEGMDDMIVLPVSHTWMMWDLEVMEQIRIFFECGHFEPETVKETTRGQEAGQ